MKGDKRCRSCGQPIRWATTEKGRAMPLDVDPVVGGNIDLINDGCDGLLARVVAAEAGRERHVSHFATCPNAASHRGRQSKGRP